MRQLGLVACQLRPWSTTTLRGEEHSTASDLVGRDFTAETPGSKLVGDITYIHTWAGWLYLATVIDCFNKEVIGYAMADHMSTSLVADAVGMAARNHSLAAGCIFHSDRGTQYTSTEFSAKLAVLHMRQSLVAPGAVTIMRWPNSFSRPSKMSGCTAPSIRPGTKRNTILPAILKCSIIGGGSTQHWATGPRTRSALNIQTSSSQHEITQFNRPENAGQTSTAMPTGCGRRGRSTVSQHTKFLQLTRGAANCRGVVLIALAASATALDGTTRRQLWSQLPRLRRDRCTSWPRSERGTTNGQAEELHDGREHADHGRRGDDGQTVAGEDLSSSTASEASKTAVSMKPCQSSLRLTPPAWKRLKT